MDNKNTLNFFQVALLILLLGVIMTNLVGTGSIFIDDGVQRAPNGDPVDLYYDADTDSWVPSVHIADVHNVLINSEMHFHTNTTTTLSNATSGNGSEIYIWVADTTGFVVGDSLHIEDGRQESTHPRIQAITGNRFTLDRRIDLAHPVGTNVTKSILDLSTFVGTLENPIEYWIEPPEGEVWHINRLLFSMEMGTAGDLGLFGNLPALTNGVLLRARINGSYGSFTNWKVNSDIKSDMFDVEFDTRSGGGGTYGMSGRGSFSRAGAIVRLDGDTNDRIELYVQDDITGLDSWTMKMQGHMEGR